MPSETARDGRGGVDASQAWTERKDGVAGQPSIDGLCHGADGDPESE